MSDEEKVTLNEYARYLWETEARQSASRKIELVFQIYAVLGAALGFFALIYFVFRKLEIEITPFDQKILILAGTSFAVSILSSLLLFLRRQRLRSQLERRRYMVSASEFLMQWAQFEAWSKARLELLGREFNRMSIRAIVQELLSADLLTQDDAMQLEEVLRYRNLIVHGDGPADPETLARMTEKLRSVTREAFSK